MRPGEGITGTAAADAGRSLIPAQAHLDPRFKGFPNLPEDQYESILAVPILAREKLAGALNVRTVEPREFTRRRDRAAARDRRPGRADDRAREALQRGAAAGRELEALARISEAVSESLYLEESLEAIVQTTVDAVGATGAALVLEDGNIAWPEGRAARTRSGSRSAGRVGRSASSSATGTRRSPSRSAPCSPRSPTTPPSRSSMAEP